MFTKGSMSRKLLCATGALAGLGFAGGYVTYQRRLEENRSCTAEDFNAAQDQTELQFALSHITDPKKCPPILLYRYSTCPFCATTKSFLDYNKIRYECVEVEPMFKKEISMSAYKKVPQLKFCVRGDDGPFLVDSEVIVSTVAKHVGMGKQLEDPEVKKWREWARGPMVRLLTLEFNSSLLNSWGSYSYIDNIETIPYKNKIFLKLVGAPVMYLVAQYVTKPRLLKSGDLLPTDDPKVKLHNEIDRFVKEGLLDGKKKFHGGSKPDLADLDTHGVLQSVRGHRLYNEIIEATTIKPWLERMDEAVGNEKYIPK
ncbi:glutathione-S-transferase/glutaredoxin, putative [Trypanosoma equiperdum]|uniref:Glutathione-S-transferase/glutaredoxin, putative n=4 Tax=Trypanozoon TaxID=39700 RepID=Q57WG5_TRYB2|nr:glutathione-S-transferase/glutaredoxin,putative [Trypanosoma brucei gambiense DAL972]XP_845973.1 glutathione-S-transferase/glutaredoxin, putative [Trypanosoma brucei brucei TREU927]AAX70056.1 glutathione-S-transferase/glutaredoxin, putative [Trypanosoma brucei]RHW71354.1 glutathione-S-transferase/glutaredoxin [Trypanosoma brucei equiperdum]SCU68542.1 glutathione-S-transferase/glutaredoxin, putative [Trypanosoma equiperdum]AAZ12414.1 glutathione-S-transferase/glutaredoxin, putative [Trypanos|eukprot:XP_011774731.1 glutathione-S-transferase/glutaredoxin,putative [Trypanosoma brucei gambiense DAL972]